MESNKQSRVWLTWFGKINLKRYNWKKLHNREITCLWLRARVNKQLARSSLCDRMAAIAATVRPKLMQLYWQQRTIYQWAKVNFYNSALKGIENE